MEKIKRPLIAHFLDTAETHDGFSGATWTRIGTNVTDMSIDYGAQTETEQDIVSNSASTDVTGYQPTAAVSQQCTKDEPIFEYITKLRRNRAILGDAQTYMLNVDLWDGSADEGYSAEVQQVSVQVDSYGGAGGETPTQEFTINFIGDPVKGTAKITGGKVSFTEASSL
jgi:hypothetical protein